MFTAWRRTLTCALVCAPLLAAIGQPLRAQPTPRATGLTSPAGPTRSASASRDTSLRQLAPRTPAHRAKLLELRRQADSTAARIPNGRIHRLGRADALVTVEEFVDLQCPACAEGARTTNPAMRPFIDAGLVRVIAYHLPIPSHPQALDAAMVAECAADQRPEAFWTMHDQLLLRQPTWGGTEQFLPGVEQIARDINLNARALTACYQQGTHVNPLLFGLQEAMRRRVDATPTYFINNIPYRGAMPKAMVERVLREAITGDTATLSRPAPAWKQAVADSLNKRPPQ